MIAVVLALAGTLVLFGWPFVAGGSQPPFVGSLLLAAVMVEIVARRLDTRKLALLAAICAVDAALRLALVTGLAGFSPVFFLILVGGWTLGAEFGFAAGALALATSAIVTAGVGPWLPYQMLAAGVVGLGGAAARRLGSRLWLLALAGAISGFVFGALMDTWDWTTFYRGSPGFGYVSGASALDLIGRFGRFYLTTSVAYDSFRAVGNGVMVLLLGPAVIRALDRFRDRLAFRVEPAEQVLDVVV